MPARRLLLFPDKLKNFPQNPLSCDSPPVICQHFHGYAVKAAADDVATQRCHFLCIRKIRNFICEMLRKCVVVFVVVVVVKDY